MGSYKFFTISIGALILSLAAVHAAYFGPEPVFPVDDAYITLHNAMALVAGADINYPQISALTGTTSPIHLALVSFLILFVPPLWALQAAAWIGIFFYALGIVRLAFIWQAKPWQVALIVVLGLIVGRMPHQLLNGLETGLALAGLVWSIALTSERPPRYQWLLPIVCGRLPFLRPELGVVSILLLLVRAAQVWKDESDLLVAMKHLMRDILTLIAATLPWIFWHLAATGSAFPSTIAAKRLFFAEGCLRKSTKIGWFYGISGC